MERNPSYERDADATARNVEGTSSYASASDARASTNTEHESPPSDTERAVDHAVETGKERLGQAREKANDLKMSLADKLDAGAHKLRQRTDGSPAAPTTDALAADKASSAVARGMEKTAQWMRTNDVQSVQSSVEGAVKRNPGKSLLVALGLGYVVGRVLRGGGGREDHDTF